MYPLLTMLLLTCVTTFAQPPVEEAGIIYLSKDRGQNWERTDHGFPSDAVNAWIVSHRMVIAGTNTHGILISSNQAKSWYPSNKGLPKNTRITSLISYKTLLFAGTYADGIFLSRDNGESWNAASTGLRNLTIRCFYAFGSLLLAGTNDGIYLSYDDGKSWAAEKNGLQINAFSMCNQQLLAATNQGVLASKDYGTTWNWVFRESAIYTLAADDKEIYLMNFFGAVYRSNASNFIWLKADMYLPLQCTFQLTPTSRKFLSIAWKKAFSNLNSFQNALYTNGLPEDLAFTELLETPFGLLAGAVLPMKVE